MFAQSSWLEEESARITNVEISVGLLISYKSVLTRVRVKRDAICEFSRPVLSEMSSIEAVKSSVKN